MIGGEETRRCTSAVPASKSILDGLTRRVLTNDRVVDDDEALAFDLGERVQLMRTPCSRMPCSGWMNVRAT